jgi:hypothetical protein
MHKSCFSDKPNQPLMFRRKICTILLHGTKTWKLPLSAQTICSQLILTFTLKSTLAGHQNHDKMLRCHHTYDCHT